MARYQRINLDGMSDTVSAPAGAELTPGQVVNLTSGTFSLATDGVGRIYAVEKSQISVDVEDTIASGDGVNGDKIVAGRTFALLLAASQTIALDDELEVANGFLQAATTPGSGQFWANEALTTGVGENFLISVTVK